jgi:two-component system response regulator
MNNNDMEILLVEDNLNDAEMTIRSLKKYHLTNKLTHLRDGVEALDFIFGRGKYEGRNTSVKPKIILLDLKMPLINGIEVLRELKSDERTKTIPVVVLTSSKEDPDVRTCYELGVNAYVVKPVGFENFSKAVSEIGLFWTLFNEVPNT